MSANTFTATQLSHVRPRTSIRFCSVTKMYSVMGKELLDNVKENIHAEQIHSDRSMNAETLDDFRD